MGMASGGLYSNEDLRYMPDVQAAVHRRGNRFAYILTVIAFVFVVTFLGWAHFAVLDEVTRGEGTVVPSSKTQVIQNLEGGILAAILVREGDIVEPGAILVRIDNTAAQANFRDSRSQYFMLSATVARLEAELEGRDPVMPEEIVEKAPAAVAEQMATYRLHKDQLAAQVRVLESQAEQRTQEIAEMNSRRRQLQQGLKLARDEYAITQPLVLKGVLPRLDLIRIDRQIADLDGELSTVRLAIPRLKTAASEAKQRIEELILTTKSEVSNELSLARAELKTVTETLFAGEDRVVRTEVRSPVRGTIKEIKHNTVGGVIRPGQDILEIVPLDDTLLIEAKIRPADIAFLRPGQEATIKITAYDFSIYGGLTAQLEQISADTILDEENQDGERFYRAYLRTDRNTMEHLGEELPIIPGMTATVEIMTGKKSVLDYIMKPILKARDQAMRER
jgi:adhesin transport system membrane fusion protein